MNIINLTQHFATETQVKDGVFEPSDKNTIKNLLTFSTIPSKEDMVERAKKLAQIALESKLIAVGIKPLHSFTERKSVDKIADDGSVQKVSVFEHIGWVGL